VKQKYDYEFEVDPEEVLQLFLDPPYAPVAPEDLKWKKPDSSAIMKLLVEQHDFSQERIESVLGSLQKSMAEKAAQSKLDQFF
jgi:flap endonuclease-1